MKPREYQQRAIDAALTSLRAGRKPVICLPTGSGKSLVLAAICATLPGRSLVLSHRKELLEQDCAALNRFDSSISAGIYSAGLSRRDRTERVIFGGVASVYKRLPELQFAGPFSTILIDECHLIAPKGEGLMYRSILDALPGAGLVGLTATPYRLDSGLLHEGSGAWFDDLCIEVRPSELVKEGYLSPVVGVGGAHSIDTDGVHQRAGEFVSSELSQIACNDDLVTAAVRETLRHADGRQHGIVFAIDVAHAQMLLAALLDHDESACLITGKTPAAERADLLDGFKSGGYRWCVNVNVLSTGFDFPGIDCVVMTRPTLSKAMFVQAVGRGMRRADGKENCLLVDFGRNVARHGSIDLLANYTQHRTPQEEQRIRSAAREARDKQYRHAARAFSDDPMTGAASDLLEVPVRGVKYIAQAPKKYPDKRNIVAIYDCGDMTVRQWVCLEYQGKARWHAEQWFQRRGMPAPRDWSLGLHLARKSPIPQSLSIRFDPEFNNQPKVVVEHFRDGQTEQQEEAA